MFVCDGQSYTVMLYMFLNMCRTPFQILAKFFLTVHACSPKMCGIHCSYLKKREKWWRRRRNKKFRDGGGDRERNVTVLYVGALCNWTAVCKVFRFLAVFTQVNSSRFPLKYYELDLLCCGCKWGADDESIVQLRSLSPRLTILTWCVSGGVEGEETLAPI